MTQFAKDGSTDDKFFKRWDWILDEMIWAFNQKCRDDWEGDYYEYREMGPEESKILKSFWFETCMGRPRRTASTPSTYD